MRSVMCRTKFCWKWKPAPKNKMAPTYQIIVLGIFWWILAWLLECYSVKLYCSVWYCVLPRHITKWYWYSMMCGGRDCSKGREFELSYELWWDTIFFWCVSISQQPIDTRFTRMHLNASGNGWVSLLRHMPLCRRTIRSHERLNAMVTIVITTDSNHINLWLWEILRHRRHNMTSSNGNNWRYCPCVTGIHRSPMDCPCRGTATRTLFETPWRSFSVTLMELEIVQIH